MAVEIRTLGGFAVRRDEQDVPPAVFGGRLARRLVRILLTRRGALVPTDLLIEALWPRRPPANPPANVKVLVNRARRALGDPALIRTGTGGYALEATDRCVVDVEVFRQRVAAGHDHLGAGRTDHARREFGAALELWVGEPLPEDAYEDWARSWRQDLVDTHLEALEGAATAALAHDPASAVPLAQQVVRDEPLRERGNLLLVRAHASAGDPAAAIIALHTYRRLLADELGLDPSAEADALERALLHSEPLELPVGAPAHVGVPGFQPLVFVGREDELARVAEALGPAGSGTVVVAGRSGAGKSRLLDEIASRASIPVLGVRAFRATRAEPWALARSLLTEALGLGVEAAAAVPARAVDALADVLPEIRDHATGTGAPVVADSRRALLVEGAVRLLATAAGAGALLFVDDVQWADASSLELVAVTHSRVPALRMVIAYRPEEVDPASPADALLRDLEHVSPAPTVIRLGPLTADAIADLVVEPVAGVLASDTDRTPLAVTEVLRRLVLGGAVYRGQGGRWRPLGGGNVGAQARDAARVGQARSVLVRVRRLAQLQRELLSLLALTGRETPAAVLGEAAGLEHRTLLTELEALARLDLARLGEHGWVTAHDSVAETLTADLDREQRGRLHALLAPALDRHNVDRAEVAAHLAGAGDAEAAATAYAVAAVDRLERFADREAGELAQRGLALTRHRPTRSRLLEVDGEVLARTGQFPRARAAIRAALAEEDEPARRARLRSRLAGLALGADDVERGRRARRTGARGGRDERRGTRRGASDCRGRRHEPRTHGAQRGALRRGARGVRAVGRRAGSSRRRQRPSDGHVHGGAAASLRPRLRARGQPVRGVRGARAAADSPHDGRPRAHLHGPTRGRLGTHRIVPRARPRTRPPRGAGDVPGASR